MINLQINGIPVSVPEGATLLEAARQAGIRIPTLCYLKGLNEIGACRVCVVEIKGARSLAASCVYPAAEGMEVFTNTEAVRKSRKMTTELILSNHRMECLTCRRNRSCELRELADELGIDAVRYGAKDKLASVEDSAPYLVRDNSKCVLCRRCTAVCRTVQQVGVISPVERGFNTHISCAYDRELIESDCISCGQCVQVCPTGALTVKDDTERVWTAISDPKKHVVVAPAPAVRVALGEEFGMPVGTNVEGQLVTALRRLGFDKVFDVDFAADLTIMEEGAEFLERLKNGGKLPMITSCSPGWVRYCEQHHPDMIENLSTCRSPQQMFGAMVKTYYAEKAGIAPEDIVVVTIMPCVAKKYEVLREEQRLPSGVMPVDVSITTQELARMIRLSGIVFDKLPGESFDLLMGMSTGAGLIFGASGGVMEAALRTVAELTVGKDSAPLEFHEVRGSAGIREASYELDGRTVRVCAASGVANIKKVLDGVKSGELSYDFIEFMACPGGCVNGGGQPMHTGTERGETDIPKLRAAAIYTQEEKMQFRKSHENPYIKQLYAEFLGEAGGHKSHELLHCTYRPQKRYRID